MLEPISEADIWEMINSSCEKMSFEQGRLWEVIKITPEKWREKRYGKECGGFWVVGIIGNKVVWYNDIEDGFNCSRYSKYGEIDDYWCNQDQLEWTVQNIINEIKNGYTSGSSFGPPRPIVPWDRQ